MSSLLEASPPRLWKNAPVHWGVLALCVGATIAAFYPVLLFMVHTWGYVEEYSYGYYIPLVSLFLIWQRSDELRRQPLEGDFRGLALIAAALLLRWIGEVSAIRLIGQYGFVVAMFGIAVCSIGWRGTKLIAVPLAILLFMIPLPQFLLRELSHGLQLLSSQLGVGLIRLFGISVFLEGNVIDLGAYKLQVAEACNGLRYLFPLMVLGFLAAYFMRGPRWMRTVLVLSTIPLTILINSLRIGLIGVTVEYWGRAMAEGLLHDLEGWFMFVVCLALLVGEMMLLARLTGGPHRLQDVFAIDLPEPPPRGAVAASHPVSLASLACTLLLVVTAALAVGTAPRAQLAPPRAQLTEFPLRLDGVWEGRLDRIEPDVLAALALDDYLIANYRRGEEPWVNFYVAYYKSQSSGESTHSPRTCIPGGGWNILTLDERPVPVRTAATGRTDAHAPPPDTRVNRVVIQRGDDRQLVYYWFSQRGRHLTDEMQVKWYVLHDAVTRNRSDGALIRLVTPMLAGESEAAADARLASFLYAVEPRLAAYVPH